MEAVRPNLHLLVPPAELADRLASGTTESPLVLDLRPAEAFAAGHLPGAVHLDIWGVTLIDTSPAPLRAFSWMVAWLFGARGVRDDGEVVVYDATSGLRAARAFWFLEYLGLETVRLLDGGFDAWRRAGLPVTAVAVAPRPEPGRWSGSTRVHRGRLATWSDVRDRIGDPQTTLLDTRSADEFRGVEARAARGGAIPGAVHVEWSRALDAQGAYRSPSELAALYRSAGVSPERETIVYCQGGYRSAHTYVALRLVGHQRLRNYLGSWKEWGNRVDLPIEEPAEER